MKKYKYIIIAVLVVALGAGVFFPIAQSIGLFAEGNNEKYSAQYCEINKNSPIAGKTYIFLGSSVTYGSASRGESFVDFLAKKDRIYAVKEAVSGTTLVDSGKNSYIARMEGLDKNIRASAFICQLSTNDATKKKPLGKIAEGFDKSQFDTKTVAGAIEYIIAYAQETWHCPVAFYTGTKYDSAQYEKMVNLLLDIQKKWNISVLDLWHDEDMNKVTPENYKLYMANGIHPTRAGYKLWWLPKFESLLISLS